MKKISLVFGLLALSAQTMAQKVVPPETGAYVGAYVDAGPLSDEVRPFEVANFENLIGKDLAWVYFSNNWVDGNIEFPKANVKSCRDMGRIPYIRLMPWSQVSARSNGDPIFTMDAFLQGQFDSALKKWAREALAFPGPMILEFGPEVNGDWFPWNGRWNGAGTKNQYGDPNIPDGPEKFRDAYRRVIDIFKAEGLTDVTWVLHLDTARAPHTNWNRAKYYYPGDDYIDWIGLSVFGAQLHNHAWQDFMPKLKNFWPEIEDITRNKPVMISEFATIEDRKSAGRKAQWLARALRLVETGLYPIKGITYWNSPGWLEDGSADFRITSSETSLQTFKQHIQKPFWQSFPFSTHSKKDLQ